jgi:copper(I)-binding protein
VNLPRRPTRTLAVALASVAALALAAVVVIALTRQPATGVVARDAAVGATNEPVAAVYLELENHDAEPRTLLGATCGCGVKVTLHLTEHAAGLSKMVDTVGIEIAPDDTVVLHPGGSHLMLMGLEQPLAEGEQLDLELTFDGSAPVQVQVPVVSLASLAERVPEPDDGSN